MRSFSWFISIFGGLLSWHLYHSVPWAIVHFLGAEFWVPYHFIITNHIFN